MSQYELHPIPLDKILAEVREQLDKGYDPMWYLSQFRIGDDGGYLRKL